MAFVIYASWDNFGNADSKYIVSELLAIVLRLKKVFILVR